MQGKIVTREGKEIEMTKTLNDLANHVCEDYDQLRAGQIDVPTAHARASIAGIACKTGALMLMNAKMMNYKPNNEFLGIDEVKQIPKKGE